ncbi:MAG: transaldolase family protein [Desulfobacterales bacterium]
MRPRKIRARRTTLMPQKSVLEKLWEIEPQAELWWDSSPLIYESFRRRLIDRAPDKPLMSAWLERLYSDRNPPGQNLFRGVTTNPRLSFNVVKDNPGQWTAWIDAWIRSTKCAEPETVFWETYKEVIRRGALALLPIFEASGRKHGFHSAQADPRCRQDPEKMVAQGVELHRLSPNIMIKIPGTLEGYEAIRRLTALGIPTNNTISLVMPQFVACMSAVAAGLKEARAAGVGLSGWRSVITAMSSRFGTLGELHQQAAERGIDLSEADVRWAEIALIKKACALVRNHAEYRGKMLVSSMRVSPIIGGKAHVWHLEKLAGADIVFTIPPSFLEALLLKTPDLEFSRRFEEPVPAGVMEKLFKIPYFERGLREDGYSPAEFNTHPALVSTARDFCVATQGMLDFVAARVAALSG